MKLIHTMDICTFLLKPTVNASRMPWHWYHGISLDFCTSVIDKASADGFGWMRSSRHWNHYWCLSGRVLRLLSTLGQAWGACLVCPLPALRSPSSYIIPSYSKCDTDIIPSSALSRGNMITFRGFSDRLAILCWLSPNYTNY